MSHSEGMRRLSHALGVVGAFAWFVFVSYILGAENADPKGWEFLGIGIFYLIGCAICYGLVYGAIQLIDWVWAGFQEGDE